MASLNKVLLIGNLTRDPDVRELPSSSTYVATTGLAVNNKFSKDKNEVMFIDIVAYGRTAEVIGEYTKKGSPILVEGRLVFRQWESEGQKRSKHEVIVETFQFLNGRRDDQESYDNSYDSYSNNKNFNQNKEYSKSSTSGNTNESSDNSNFDSNNDSITEDDVPF